jgi:hypothetical protein
MKGERERRNGVALGPDSPLRATKTAERATRKALKVSRDYEHDEQVALFVWLDRYTARVPDFAKAFAVPNGGFRHIRTAGRLKAEGVKPGIPDVLILVARCGFLGLMIEMKRPGGSLSPSQADWQFTFTKDGFKVVLATTWQQAREHICTYFELDPTQFP